MPWIAAGAALIGAYQQSQASKQAANTQAGAAGNAANLQYQMFQQQQANQQPWLQAGTKAIGQLSDLTAPGGAMVTMPTSQDIMSQFAPNYQFQLQQGLGQAQNAANAGGGLLSGNALQGLNTYAQNFAQNAYQNAFNNYQTSQSNIFNRLASIAGAGQTTAGNLMSGGMQTAGNMGNLMTSGAAAQAAGQVGQANALNQGLGNIAGAYMANKYGWYGKPVQ